MHRQPKPGFPNTVVVVARLCENLQGNLLVAQRTSIDSPDLADAIDKLGETIRALLKLTDFAPDTEQDAAILAAQKDA